MADLIYEEILKSSDDLKVGDEIRVGGMHTSITKIVHNDHDGLVLHLTITGARFKTRSEMTLIIPKKVPITTLK